MIHISGTDVALVFLGHVLLFGCALNLNVCHCSLCCYLLWIIAEWWCCGTCTTTGIQTSGFWAETWCYSGYTFGYYECNEVSIPLHFYSWNTHGMTDCCIGIVNYRIQRKKKRILQLGKLILKEGKRLILTWCLFRSLNHLLLFFLVKQSLLFWAVHFLMSFEFSLLFNFFFSFFISQDIKRREDAVSQGKRTRSQATVFLSFQVSW